MDASVAAEVLRMVRQVRDPRRHNRVHPLSELIVMSLCAILCGADSWEDVNEWSDFRESFLREFLTLPRGIPCADTFARVFARLDPAELERCLSAWLAALNAHGRPPESAALPDATHIAIDGKSLRRSFQHSWDVGGMTRMVSAFASGSGMSLAQLAYDQTEGELEAIGRLLKLMDLKGCTVSIDALGCQTHIARQIVEKKGQYVLCVKRNQPELHDKVRRLLREAVVERLDGWSGDYHEETCAGHGRVETRRVWYTTDVEHLGAIRDQWAGLSAVAMVQCHRSVNGQEPKVHRRYYLLSDATLNAQQAGDLIRRHWRIENGLHYVLDVSFGEDQSRVRKDHGAENLSRLRRLTANLLRRTTSKASIKCRRKCCGWSDDFLVQALFSGLSPQPQQKGYMR